MVFVLRMACVCGVTVVQKVDTNPVDKMSLLVCGVVVLVAPPFGNSRITFFLGKIRSLSSFNIASISKLARITTHFCAPGILSSVQCSISKEFVEFVIVNYSLPKTLEVDAKAGNDVSCILVFCWGEIIGLQCLG